MGRWQRSPRRATRRHAATGRVVFVTGEPGIGKTSLVTRFLRDLGAGARVLLGTCDDLSIPRPLGPIRDLVGSVSDALGEALSAGAAPHDIQTLLIAELELPPQPTVLVLEDVHWADNATLDSITVLGRRIGSLPALLVLTFRGGEIPPGHPLHAALGAISAEASVFLELAPLSESAVASLAGADAREVYAATRGNPFYVNELLASRATAELPPSVAKAVLGRAARLDEPSRRLVELASVVPSRVATSLLDAVMPDWAEAAEEPERRQLLEVDPAYVRFRHELARHAIRSSIPIAARRRLHAEILEALLAADADPADIVHHAEAAGAEDVVAEYALVAARRASALGSNREAYSHYRRASQFVDRLPAAERASVLEELATVAYSVGRLDGAFVGIERAIEVYRALGDEEAVGRCSAGHVALPLGGGRRLLPHTRRRSRRSRSSSRSARRSSSRAPTASSLSWRCSPRMRVRRSCGGTGRSSSRRGWATSARARTRSSTSPRPGSTSTTVRPRRCSRRTPSLTRPATGTRRHVRSRTSASACCGGCSRRRRFGTRARRSPTPRSTRC